MREFGQNKWTPLFDLKDAEARQALIQASSKQGTAWVRLRDIPESRQPPAPDLVRESGQIVDVWLENEMEGLLASSREEGVRFLQLYPESCARLADSPERVIDVATFVPPSEICKKWSLDNMGMDDGVRAYALAPVADGGHMTVYWNDVYLQQPEKVNAAKGPHSPVMIFIQEQLDLNVKDKKAVWGNFRDIADGKTLRPFGESFYILRRATVPHPKLLDGGLPAVEYETDTTPSKKGSIQQYSFYDVFRKALKKHPQK